MWARELASGPCKMSSERFIFLATGAHLCSDFAEEFPLASVIGTDLSPIQVY